MSRWQTKNYDYNGALMGIGMPFTVPNELLQLLQDVKGGPQDAEPDDAAKDARMAQFEKWMNVWLLWLMAGEDERGGLLQIAGKIVGKVVEIATMGRRRKRSIYSLQHPYRV